ncbi:MAG TPA: ATP-binding protein, partial [Cryomorphaceae bacterium]|nr:ATP-binding protein [Cryomorphaceae bacterium]
FQNLIGNALKYAQKDKRPEIEISSKDLGKVWEISVSDNGIGIDKEYHQKIFILFERLHTQEEYSGTGLGLSIVKKVIENEGGRVSVKSEPGKGTTICFTLPKIT